MNDRNKQISEMIHLAKESGFSVAEPLDVSTLEFSQAVRDMCAEGKCSSYGRNWSCPPICGTLEEIEEKVRPYSKGILLQTIGFREDSFDFDAMRQIEADNKIHFENIIKRLRQAGSNFFAMPAGTCTRCEICTYPDSPCCTPEYLFPSMEACGLFVSKICKDNGLPYYYGEQQIAFTCLLLFD